MLIGGSIRIRLRSMPTAAVFQRLKNTWITEARTERYPHLQETTTPLTVGTPRQAVEAMFPLRPLWE